MSAWTFLRRDEIYSRTCMHTEDKDGQQLCGASATKHVLWVIDEKVLIHSALCQLHYTTTAWRERVQEHPLGPDCYMPGARWFHDENVCHCEGNLDAAPVFERELELAR